MSKPSLSIIMPVYNAGQFVSEAIRSVLNQTFQDLELIIIDNGSADNTKAVIDSFQDERIKYVVNEKNMGIVYSRNRGIKMAKGEFVGMLDADDIAYPEKFEAQIKFLRANEEFGMVGAWAKFIDEEGKPMPGSWKLKAPPEMIPSIMLFKNYFLQSAVLYRKDCIKNFSFTDGFDILEDYLIWLEIIKQYKSWNLQQYLVKYRIHTAAATKKNSGEKLEKEKRVFRMQFNELGIDPSEQEMEDHLLIRNDLLIKDTKTLRSIEKWLLKIIKANKQIGIYDQEILTRVVVNRWMKVCYKAEMNPFSRLHLFLSSKIFTTFIKLTGHKLIN